MPVWLEWIVYILIVIVMIGVLVAIHEAGHLAVAKMFRVYCFEYSIGMGPKIVSKKRKGGETKFSIRAIPFGGYVSMYGETDQLPPDVEQIDPARSLNAIAKWKKCLVLVAGVTLNFILGLTLIYIGDQFCPIYYTNIISRSESYRYLDSTYVDGVLTYIENNRVIPSGKTEEDGYRAKDYKIAFGIYESLIPNVVDTKQQTGILATHVRLYESASAESPMETEYVAVYSPANVTKQNPLANCVYFYPAATDAEVPQSLLDLGFDQVPQLYNADNEDNAYNLVGGREGSYFTLPLHLAPLGTASVDCSYEEGVELFKQTQVVCNDPALFRISVKDGKVADPGINIEVNKAWLSFPDAWKQWAHDVPNACSAVVKGFATLFLPNGWKGMSGIIGITTAMPQIASAGGARLIFYFAGLISINLAFFNLLPFPGLDGWQLLVTIIEGISRKKVPAKVQSIVSTIGIVLLLALMAFIAVKDVITIFIK